MVAASGNSTVEAWTTGGWMKPWKPRGSLPRWARRVLTPLPVKVSLAMACLSVFAPASNSHRPRNPQPPWMTRKSREGNGFPRPGRPPFALDRGRDFAFDTIREWEVERLARNVGRRPGRRNEPDTMPLPRGTIRDAVPRNRGSAPEQQKRVVGMKKFVTGILGSAALALAASAASAATLDDVKARGHLKCGVNTSLAGFSAPNDKGEWTGLDVDFCRAVAAAIFGDGDKVNFTALSAKDRFTALQSGEVDVLSRNTTWTINRDTALGFNFAGVTYYDGQGFMINAKQLPGVNSALQLSGASVCVQAGTTTELNLADYFSANNMEYNPVVFEKFEEANAAYD